jgi:hypothetical protein
MVQRREDDDDHDIVTAVCNPGLTPQETHTCHNVEGGGQEECEVGRRDEAEDRTCPEEHNPNQALADDLEHEEDQAEEIRELEEYEECVAEAAAGDGDGDGMCTRLHRSNANYNPGRW